MENLQFSTHNGELVSGQKLIKAINKVADDRVKLYQAIRKEDAYAPHVTEQQKDEILLKDLAYAEEIRSGQHLNNFTIWQLVNTVLTGECVGFLP